MQLYHVNVLLSRTNVTCPAESLRDILENHMAFKVYLLVPGCCKEEKQPDIMYIYQQFPAENVDQGQARGTLRLS